MKKLAKILSAGLLSGVLLISNSIVAFAYAWDEMITVTQPDGESIEIEIEPRDRTKGEDRFGYLIIKDNETGWYVYGNVADKKLVPTEIKATEKSMNNYKDADKMLHSEYYDAIKSDTKDYIADLQGKPIEFQEQTKKRDVFKPVILGRGEAKIVDGCTMVPFNVYARCLSKRFYNKGFPDVNNKNPKYTCSYDSSKKELSVYFEGLGTATVVVGSNKAYVEREDDFFQSYECDLGVAPYIENGMVYVPLDFANQYLWLFKNRTVEKDKVIITLL